MGPDKIRLKLTLIVILSNKIVLRGLWQQKGLVNILRKFTIDKNKIIVMMFFSDLKVDNSCMAWQEHNKIVFFSLQIQRYSLML
jgi:hypothetical protein